MKNRSQQLPTYDVIIVGAGPAGSSAATFLSRQGVSCLLLDRAKFPREKVCGDGLTPQALYWLNQLGCLDEVFKQTSCYIPSTDLYINGKFVLTGKFPDNTPYPSFCTLLRREVLDHILVRHARKCGARFLDGHAVKRIEHTPEGVKVETVSNGQTQHFSGKILIGADGAGSRVSRFLGNTVTRGTKALSVRAYFTGVTKCESYTRMYFNEPFFPGYAWIFADDRGGANVGLGIVADPNFPVTVDLKEQFKRFVDTDLADLLDGAQQSGPPAGGWALVSRAATRIGERIMLTGDAANCVDPLNGGGIHKAMESAWYAAQAATAALGSGDCSAKSLDAYEQALRRAVDPDWRSAELLLTMGKNPHLKHLSLALLERIGGMVRQDQSIADFCSGIFSGMVPQRNFLSPGALVALLPSIVSVMPSMLTNLEPKKMASLSAHIARGVLGGLRGVMTNPAQNFAWGVELSTKAMALGGNLVESMGVRN